MKVKTLSSLLILACLVGPALWWGFLRLNGPAAIFITIRPNSWTYSPDAIILTRGKTETIHVLNEDTYAHGFAVRELGLNEYLAPGTTTTFTVTPTTSGVFVSYCSVVCGAGHSGMRGKVIVR